MAKQEKFPYGKAKMFGRDLPLTKSKMLNKVAGVHALQTLLASLKDDIAVQSSF